MRIDLDFEVLVLIGPPGSGKSTLANLLSALYGIAILCPDDIRKSMFGNKPYDYRDNDLVWDELYEELHPCMEQGTPVIIDATNTSHWHRRNLLSELPTHVKVTGLWFQVSLNECLKRNAARADKLPVPEEVIQEAFESLIAYPPEYRDGYDNLLVIQNGKLARIKNPYGKTVSANRRIS